MKEKSISIIIPTINEEDEIGTLIEYLQKAGTHFVKEIIIVDGGSRDKTCEVADEYGAVVFKSPEKGRAKQMNFGAKQARGSIFYFLHADSLPPKNFDIQIRNAVEKGYDSGCFQLSFDIDSKLLSIYCWFTRFRTTLVRFGDQSLFVTQSMFNRVGGFDEKLIVMEDQKIVRILKKLGSFILLNDNVVTSARKYEENGIIRLQFIFAVIFVGYYLGIEQRTLSNIYKSLIKI